MTDHLKQLTETGERLRELEQIKTALPAQIVDARASGVTTAEICEALDLSRAWVFRLQQEEMNRRA